MASTSTRTIEDLWAVNGQRGQEVPPLRPDLVPNFSEIRKVYDTFFAPGLDTLLATGSTRWFALKGWNLLEHDRTLLAQFMIYLTYISNTPAPATAATGTIPRDQAVVASQEARVTWSLLNLVVTQAQEGTNDDDAERFARRVKSIEAILTSEPVVRTGSMSDFVYQDPEPDHDDMDVDMTGIPTVANNPLLEKPFSKQITARSDEFWQLVEQASERPTQISSAVFDRLRSLLDGKEERDIVYAIMLLGAQPKPPEASKDDKSSRPGSNHSSPSRAARRQERDQAIRLLEQESSGRATNMVFQNIAAMGARAFIH